jgi:N-alpha-acetyltransferase 50
MAAISFAAVTEKNVEVFRVLNVHCLPVRYADKFYVDLLKTPAEFTKYGTCVVLLCSSPISSTDAVCYSVFAVVSCKTVALINDVIVGGIGCRIENRADGKQDVYVMTLSVLAPYRRLGVGVLIFLPSLCTFPCKYRLLVGKKLLESVLASLDKHPNVVRVYLHVHTVNETALAFYSKFGFVSGGVIADYYKKITPPDAVLLEWATARA